MDALLAICASWGGNAEEPPAENPASPSASRSHSRSLDSRSRSRSRSRSARSIRSLSHARSHARSRSRSPHSGSLAQYPEGHLSEYLERTNVDSAPGRLAQSPLRCTVEYIRANADSAETSPADDIYPEPSSPPSEEVDNFFRRWLQRYIKDLEEVPAGTSSA